MQSNVVYAQGERFNDSYVTFWEKAENCSDLTQDLIAELQIEEVYSWHTLRIQ